MKRFILFAVILTTLNIFCFAQIKIEIDSLFHINPITGINGDSLEANSKFIQRMIYAPLVFPLADPYLTDKFEVVLDLSLIEPEIEYKDKNDKEYKNYSFTDGKNNPMGQIFRVKLRKNINFSYYNNKKIRTQLIEPEDVVFSYRLSRITMDRIYKNWDGQNINKLPINTLMYSRIKVINSIYCDNEYIIFELERSTRCEDFLTYLVYVPILSQFQIVGKNNETEFYKDLSKNIYFKDINVIPINEKEYKKYDDYDLLKLLQIKSLMDSFYRAPRACGQYIVKDVTQINALKEDMFKGITLERNPFWCKFNDNDVKNIGRIKVDHGKFSKQNLTLEINYQTFQVGAWARINNSKEGSFLYNQPISSMIFNNSKELKEASEKFTKGRMHISHSLYGIFFGKYKGPLSNFARKMFYEITDRYKIENILKYTLIETDLADFLNIINPPEDKKNDFILISDLYIKRLYLPFYTDSDTKSEIKNLNTKVENDDSYFMFMKKNMQTESVESNSFEVFFKNLKGDQDRERNFYETYIKGYKKDKNKTLSGLFDNCFDELAYNGKIKIKIYYINGDTVSYQIARQYEQLLKDFFKTQKKNGFNYSESDIRIEGINESIDNFDSNLRQWNDITEKNAKENTISLLIRGWNFKFDINDQLAFSNADTTQLNEIKDSYNKLINGDSKQSALALYAEIAQRIIGFVPNGNNELDTQVTNPVMIPIVSVENYFVFPISNNIFEAESIADKDELKKIIMLLPYYWEQKGH